MTKQQKLEAIEKAMQRIASGRSDFTCSAFSHIGWEAEEWYGELLKEHIKDEPFNWLGSSTLFDDVGYYPAQRNARLLWLAFLYLWVSEGVVE